MRKQLFNCLIIIVLLIFIDQITKLLAVNTLQVHRNYGLFLGTFSQSSVLFRVVTLSTLSGFLIFIFSVLFYLLPKSLYFIKYTLSVILSGILGNVADRLTRGYTIDFIPINLPFFNASFNIADIFLWFGTCYFIYSLFKYEDEIWHPENSRNQYLVNPKEQLRLAFKFMLTSFFTSIILGLFSITFLKSFNYIPNAQIFEFLTIYILLAILFSISTFLIGVIVSHKTAGPLYAFELYVERMLQGDSEPLTLRDGDNYRHLEEVAEKLRKNFNKL